MDQETERENRTRALVDAFAAIREGDLSQTWLARFSDLPRDGAKTFGREWAMLPETLRVDVGDDLTGDDGCREGDEEEDGDTRHAAIVSRLGGELRR